MSWKFHGYTVSKNDLWDTVDEIRSFYSENHLAYTSLRTKLRRAYENGRLGVDFLEEWDRLVRNTVEAFGNDPITQLQIFDIGEDEYAIRVLEKGYYFYNNASKFSALDPLDYDTRTDLTEAEKENEETVHHINDLINDQHYFLVPIVTKDELEEIYWDEAHHLIGSAND